MATNTIQTPSTRRNFYTTQAFFENLTGYLFILPSVLIIGLFGLFPIVYSLYMSTLNWRARKGGFIGMDNYEKAIAGYAKAVQSAPNDIQLRLEYTNALFYAEQSATDESKKQQYRAESEQQLLKAYGLLAASSDPVTKMKVYRALTFFYLYSAPPEGFEKAIKFGEEFVNDADPRKIPSGGLWVNLAAGYGQKFKWLKEQKTMTEEERNIALKDVHQKALRAAAEALKLDRNGMWLNRLRTLLRTDTSKDADDNDLEVFEKDNAFRQLLKLS